VNYLTDTIGISQVPRMF